MPDLLERDTLVDLRAGADERLARAELRRQIGRLERELAGLFGEAFGRVEVTPAGRAADAAPRALDLGGLEGVRDSLATRVAEARRALLDRTEVETQNRELLRQMLAKPDEYRWVRISRLDVGEPGCGGWHSCPRFGMLGMLMGWWRVKVSSGCPLSGRLEAVEQQTQEGQAAGAAEAHFPRR